MNVNAEGTRLAGLTKELSVQWQQTKEHWSDEKSAEFERNYLEELLVNVDKAVQVIAQLDKVLNKIRTDCE